MAAATPQTIANLPQYAIVNTASSGTTDIVAGTSGWIVVLDAYQLVPSAAVTATWYSHTAGAITGPMPIGGTTAPLTIGATYREGLCQTAAGEALSLNLSGAVQVGGHVTYHLIRST